MKKLSRCLKARKFLKEIREDIEWAYFRLDALKEWNGDDDDSPLYVDKEHIERLADALDAVDSMIKTVELEIKTQIS